MVAILDRITCDSGSVLLGWHRAGAVMDQANLAPVITKGR
jgi:hypothetical protein